MEEKKYSRILKAWLLTGVVMLVVQVVVGGITRLTGSGLSITTWDIVYGTLPPMSDAAWQESFDLYKATPQYREINEGMELGTIFQSGTFKFIYFWEWVHRLWARVMGFVFLIPFVIFWWRGDLDTMLKRRLIGVFLLAALAASFGWIMVASGLIERPWVNAYKLALHLSIAFVTYGLLWWTYLKTDLPNWGSHNFGPSLRFRSSALIFFVLLCIQIFVGGVMSGMKAGVVYPTWPDMNGEMFPSIVFDGSAYTYENFNYYDRQPLLAALIQSVHRVVAYSLFFYGLYLIIKVIKAKYNKRYTRTSIVTGVILMLQFVVGIWTVVSCKGHIPVGLGVLHQFMALMLWTAGLRFMFLFVRENSASATR